MKPIVAALLVCLLCLGPLPQANAAESEPYRVVFSGPFRPLTESGANFFAHMDQFAPGQTQSGRFVCENRSRDAAAMWVRSVPHPDGLGQYLTTTIVRADDTETAVGQLGASSPETLFLCTLQPGESATFDYHATLAPSTPLPDGAADGKSDWEFMATTPSDNGEAAAPGALGPATQTGIDSPGAPKDPGSAASAPSPSGGEGGSGTSGPLPKTADSPVPAAAAGTLGAAAAALALAARRRGRPGAPPILPSPLKGRMTMALTRTLRALAKWPLRIALALAGLALAAAGTAGAFYTATDSVRNWFSPAYEEPQRIVAFYCDKDKSLNYAAVEESDITRNGPEYSIMGKSCLEYFDGNAELSSCNADHSAFSACNRNLESKIYDSKQPRISKVCFLTPLRPTSMQGWFCDVGRVAAVEGLDNLDTTRVTNLDWCFAQSSGPGLAEIVAHMDTRAVTSMRHCFYGSHMEGMNPSSWNTTAVTDMTGTFSHATGAHLDLSRWNVGSVQCMDEMFAQSFMQYYYESSGRESLDRQASCTPEWWSLDISGWQPRALASYSNMFDGCCTKDVDLSGFDNSALGQNPGIDTSYIRRVTVGEKWQWSGVKSGDGPWFSRESEISYGPWDSGKSPTPPAGSAGTYDRSCLLAVLYQGKMTVYDTVQTSTGDAYQDKWNMYYQVFQRYNQGLNDEIIPMDPKMRYTDAEQIPWHSLAADVSAIEFASAVSPASIDHWFDGFSNCRTFDLQKLDVRGCSPSSPLFEECASMEKVLLGPCWQLSSEAGAMARLPEGTWFSEAGDFRADDPLPVPGAYRRQNPLVQLTDDGVLHFRDGKADYYGYTMGNARVTKSAYLGYDWLESPAPQMPWRDWEYGTVVVEEPLAPLSCASWFSGCAARKMNLELLDTSGCLSTAAMFEGCDNLVDIVLGERFSFTGSADASPCLLPGSEWRDLMTGTALAPWQIPSFTAARYLRGLEWRAVLEETPAGERLLDFRLDGPVEEGSATETGSTVLAVFTGFERNAYDSPDDVPWAIWSNQIDIVRIEDQLQPASTSFWFAGFGTCATLSLDGLDTRRCISMTGMFDGCAAKTILLGENFSFEGAAATRLCSFPEGQWLGRASDNVHREAEIPSLKAEAYRTGLQPQVFYLANNELHFALVDPEEPGWGNSFEAIGIWASYPFDNVISDAPWKDGASSGGLNIAANAIRVAVDHPMAAASVAGWFEGFSNCTEMDLHLLDVSRCTSLQRTFYGCSKLEKLDISGWNVSSCTSLDRTFYGCYWLKELDVADWDVSQATIMEYAFYNCTRLEQLDLSAWQPEKCTDFSSMFANCNQLEALDLSRWKMSAATDLAYLFRNCAALTRLDLSAVSPSMPVDLSGMFQGCSGLEELDLSVLEVSGASDLYRTFENCAQLRTIYAPTWATAQCKHPEYTFNGCGALTGQAGSTIASIRSSRALYARLDAPSAPGLFSQKLE